MPGHPLTIRTLYRTLWHCREKAMMSTMTASMARAHLYRLIDEVAEAHEPVVITGKRANAVLISEEDWRAIQETLYLSSIPGMRESIIEGLRTPIKECSEDVSW